MIIVPLGVASATPTATRHLPSVALWREGSVFLFDCGENTQMRMLQAGLKRSKVDHVFISHFDIDHYCGLLGLLATLQLQRRDKPLTITGPIGIQEYIEWNSRFADLETGFEIQYVELEPGFEEAVVIDEEEFYVEARPLKHTKFCIGYRFQEKDKAGKVDSGKAAELGVSEDWQFKELKAGNDVQLDDGTIVESSDIVGHPRSGDSFAYITDTRYCPNAVKLAMNTNVLLHEATFSESLADKAEETGHSTTRDAARVANESQTKLLIITHFSARYTNPYVLLREAREHFFPVWLATELRPVFTDPSREKGIVKAKVYIKEIDGSGSSDKRSGGGKQFDNKQKKFRKRKSFKSKSSGNYNKPARKSSDEPRKRRSPDTYNNRDSSNNNDNSSRKPRHITPRTPFDDFNRF